MRQPATDVYGTNWMEVNIAFNSKLESPNSPVSIAYIILHGVLWSSIMKGTIIDTQASIHINHRKYALDNARHVSSSLFYLVYGRV